MEECHQNFRTIAYHGLFVGQLQIGYSIYMDEASSTSEGVSPSRSEEGISRGRSCDVKSACLSALGAGVVHSHVDPPNLELQHQQDASQQRILSQQLLPGQSQGQALSKCSLWKMPSAKARWQAWLESSRHWV